MSELTVVQFRYTDHSTKVLCPYCGCENRINKAEEVHLKKNHEIFQEIACKAKEQEIKNVINKLKAFLDSR